jgi:2-oxoglutarate ferredoxin oxidoreductase subunit beta
VIQIDADYDPCDRIAASNYVQKHHAMGEVVTGLLYVDPDPSDLHRQNRGRSNLFAGGQQNPIKATLALRSTWPDSDSSFESWL